MAISFTPDQQKVIDLHHRNILVSAAAGSGKTAVLVERIIRMICDEKHPVDIDRLLIVTFTNAAAAEMRERIAGGIADKLIEHPESEHIQKQATLLFNAQITTIDSFCLFLLRNHFHEIGLDPAFRVADEGEIKLLRQEVMQELLEDAYASGDEAFRECVEYFCVNGRESVLEQHILKLSKAAASYPWPEEWLENRKADYEIGTVEAFVASDCGQYLSDYVQRMLQSCARKMEQAYQLCETPDGPYMYGELLEKELEDMRKLAQCNLLEEQFVKVAAVSFGRLSSKKDESVSAEKKELVKALREDIKGVLQNIRNKFFATPFPLAMKQSWACNAPVSRLIELTLEFDRRMAEKKQERKMIDFSDMEHFALQILLEKREGKVFTSAVAQEYQQYFYEILTDEYQDSNLVQEYLLWAVSGEAEGRYNRFMVGDVKQSIYKFRLARPELFLEKYETYEVEDSDCQRIDLSMNFRSRTQVITAVNDVFSRIMSREMGGIAYDDRAALYAGANYPTNADAGSEFLLVEKPGSDTGINSKQAEALAIAQKVKDLRVSYQVTDKSTGELRPCRFSDMVILLRTNAGWDDVFKEILMKEGIPVHITSKTGYFAATEVQELLQVLRVLDNPRQDISLYGMMKSIFGGFTEEEIARIRAGQKAKSLYEALHQYVGTSEEKAEGELKKEKTTRRLQDTDIWEKYDESHNLRERVQDFLQKITKYRSYTVYMPARELLQTLVEECDYLNYVTALPAGSKRKANVEMLFTKASDFENTSYFGLFHFIRYIEQLEKYDVDFGEADILDENADVVRIMSIHKSKGLEFPITFVAGMGKRFNQQDANQPLIVDMDLGLATDYVDVERRIRNKTLRRAVLSAKLQEDNLAEELRVLYVAMTRAKEKLILSGCLSKAAEKWESYQALGQEKLCFMDFIDAGSYLDFLLPILPKTDIRVSVIDWAELFGSQVQQALSATERWEMLGCAGELADKEELCALKERFAFQYPWKGLEKLYTKTTVSELKIAAMAQKDEEAYHTFEEAEIVPYIPLFRKEEQKVSGTVRGNAFHRCMELLDFDRIPGGIYEEFPPDYTAYREGFDTEQAGRLLHEFLREQVENLRLTEEYFAALNEQKILRFLQCEIAYRMWSADRRGELFREQPFVFGVSAGRLGEEFPAEETVLIQGIIDVYFIEKGEIILLDYKTDVIESMENLWNRYRVQLDYYKEALESLTSRGVSEKVLYSFYLEKEAKDS